MSSAYTITIKSDKPFDKIVAGLGLTKPQIEQIGMRAINPPRTLGTLRSHATKAIAKILNLREKQIRPQFKVVRATRETLAGRLELKSDHFTLEEFIGTRDRRPNGVKAMIWKRLGWKMYPHAFEATMKSGYTGIFERERTIDAANLSASERLEYKVGLLHYRKSRLVRKPGDGEWVGRLPIRQLYGPTLQGAFANTPGVMEQATADAGQILAKNVQSMIQLTLSRRRIN